MNKVEQYIAQLKDLRHERGLLLHKKIMTLYPDVSTDMQYKMPTYHHNGHFFAWGSKKQYLSLYTCSMYRIADYKQKHPQTPTGKGCINIRDKDEFPLIDIEGVIRNALAPDAQILETEQQAMQAAKRKRSKK